MLDIEELVKLEEEVREELNDNLAGILSRLNRIGKLEEFLSLAGLNSLLGNDDWYEVHKNGIIVVVGQCDVREKELLAIAKQLGIAKDRFEFYLDYKDAERLNFDRMRYQPKYSAILVGPMPHSGTAKGDYSSIISALESEQGYPPVFRLGQNGLKISKTGFKEKLQELLSEGKLI